MLVSMIGVGVARAWIHFVLHCLLTGAELSPALPYT